MRMIMWRESVEQGTIDGDMEVDEGLMRDWYVAKSECGLIV